MDAMTINERTILNRGISRWLPAIVTGAPGADPDAPLPDVVTHPGIAAATVVRGGSSG